MSSHLKFSFFMLLDTLPFKSCISFSDSYKACAMLHHCDIPTEAHKKSCSLFHADNTFHERYFHFFISFSFLFFLVSLKNHKVEKKKKISPSCNSFVTAVSQESYGLHIAFSTAAGSHGCTSSSCARHLLYETVTP